MRKIYRECFFFIKDLNVTWEKLTKFNLKRIDEHSSSAVRTNQSTFAVLFDEHSFFF